MPTVSSFYTQFDFASLATRHIASRPINFATTIKRATNRGDASARCIFEHICHQGLTVFADVLICVLSLLETHMMVTENLHWKFARHGPRPHRTSDPGLRRELCTADHTEMPTPLQNQQEAQLSPSDHAMRLVSSNLASCHATVQKLLIRQVLTKLMV